jgi:hypothetical protein
MTQPGPGTKITIKFFEQTLVTVEVTPDQARKALGLGGTPDDDIGDRIQAFAGHSPQILRKLAPHAIQAEAVSWTLQHIDDPFGVDW